MTFPLSLRRAAALAVAGSLGTSAARAGRIDFSEYDLPNGLHVILAPEHSAPVVSSYMLYHVGSKNERPDRTGFAHFFEHLMFEGSENIPRGRIDKLVSGAGGNLNASTSYDRTDFYIDLPSNQYELALYIESERLLHGKVEQIGVDTQRQVVKEERRRSYDNQPYGGLFEELSKLRSSTARPYAWVPIGSVQYIDQATLEEFRQFYHDLLHPQQRDLRAVRRLRSRHRDQADRGVLRPDPARHAGPAPAGDQGHPADRSRRPSNVVRRTRRCPPRSTPGRPRPRRTRIPTRSIC